MIPGFANPDDRRAAEIRAEAARMARSISAPQGPRLAITEAVITETLRTQALSRRAVRARHARRGTRQAAA